MIKLIENGIPICQRPFLTIAEKNNLSEEQVITEINRLKETGVIRRFGVIVKHRELGFRNNAMIVWQIPASLVEQISIALKQFSFVTLCYQRKSYSDKWPYNLYCMIHAKSRLEITEHLKTINTNIDLGCYPTKTLISTKCYKQKGARYSKAPTDWKKSLMFEIQQGIPLESRPFRKIGDKIGIHESEIIAQIQLWLSQGMLSRFGPLYNVEKMGGEFTLVAMSVPRERFEDVTNIVNSFSEVAHNYERSHALNMWFVVACSQTSQTNIIIDQIEKATRLKCYAMPKEKEYYLNLQLEMR